ncbi:hypothetical protein DL764_000931 [Monosporascus ibericus]|uniref:Heterokaryon incompatibility domain-containing protein n=1 Tax=Monosporascus ibericus TaxID=155417 RepID=A0A4Q4TT91_9PEZI|nr:hypothetical protein DL764_000931 [Monosporascus ibericus]
MSTSVDNLPESQARGSLPEPVTNRGPRVQFARFVDNGEKIQLFSACTKDVAYYAISHVWGKTEWKHVRCLGRGMRMSPQKAKFLEERMYALVGDVAFWMDTIAVDQKGAAEVISTVQAIPAIFRNAEKTIAIREGDGIYNCCVEAVAGFSDYAEMLQMLVVHVGERHSQSVSEESYLKRLWTLQEVLLSHTIEFVVSTDVHRSKPPARRLDEDIFSDNFLEYYIASNRAATESRDYIFATMPQFPWGDELSKYGAYPESAREIGLLKVLLSSGADRDQAYVMRIHEGIAEERQRRASEEWIIPQAMKILDMMFGMVDKYQKNAALQ